MNKFISDFNHILKLANRKKFIPCINCKTDIFSSQIDEIETLESQAYAFKCPHCLEGNYFTENSHLLWVDHEKQISLSYLKNLDKTIYTTQEMNCDADLIVLDGFIHWQKFNKVMNFT